MSKDDNYFQIPTNILQKRLDPWKESRFYTWQEIANYSCFRVGLSELEKQGCNPHIGNYSLSEIFDNMNDSETFDFDQIEEYPKAVQIGHYLVRGKFFLRLNYVEERAEEMAEIHHELKPHSSYIRISRTFFEQFQEGSLFSRKTAEITEFTFRVLLGVYGNLGSNTVRRICRRDILARAYGFDSYRLLESDKPCLKALIPWKEKGKRIEQEREKNRLLRNQLKQVSRAIEFLSYQGENGFFRYLEIGSRELWFSHSSLPKEKFEQEVFDIKAKRKLKENARKQTSREITKKINDL